MSTQPTVPNPSFSGAVLGHANAQWSSRPADQSFLSVQALHDHVVARTEIAYEPKVPTSYADLRVQAFEQDIHLVGKTGVALPLSHWAFGQLSRAIGAPSDYLRDLPATLAAQNLNHGLAKRGEGAGKAKLLIQTSSPAHIRALTGPTYSRLWDQDVTRRLLDLKYAGWEPAPETDLLSGGKTVGLYASDHDVFGFMVDNDRRVFESAPGGGLSRGFMVANSEVGDKSFWLLTFLYSFICANHNIWGVDGVNEVRVRHIGKAGERGFAEMEVTLKQYAEASASDDEAKIKRCMAHQIGKTKDEVLDTLFGMKKVGLSRKMLTAAYDRAEEHQDWYIASPRSAWGIGNGITEMAREIQFADERVRVEQAAGKVFEMGF